MVTPFLFALVSASALASPSDPDRIDEPFEGLYSVTFDCKALKNCPQEVGTFENLVILGTGKPTLLGNGLGWVVTMTNPIIGSVFSFVGAQLDEATGTIHADSSGSNPADLTLVIDPATNELKGSLVTTLSPGALTFRAHPQRTVTTFFPVDGDAVAASSIEGSYAGEWAGYPSQILLKEIGTAGFAGRLTIDGTSPLPIPFHGGLLHASKGFVTLVGGSHALLKIFLVNHGGEWTGFSVSSEFGNSALIRLKKK